MRYSWVQYGGKRCAQILPNALLAIQQPLRLPCFLRDSRYSLSASPTLPGSCVQGLRSCYEPNSRTRNATPASSPQALRASGAEQTARSEQRLSLHSMDIGRPISGWYAGVWFRAGMVGLRLVSPTKPSGGCWVPFVTPRGFGSGPLGLLRAPCVRKFRHLQVHG